MDIMKKIVSLNSSHDDTTLVGGPSTSAQIIPKRPLTYLNTDVLSVVFDFLDTRDLINLSKATQVKKTNRNFLLEYIHYYFGHPDKKSDPLLEDIHHYFGHPDKKVDLSDPSIRHKITDDSLKLFSECKHINLSGCTRITNAGLAHL